MTKPNHTIKHLFTYPIKSMGGITLEETEITNTGFKHDREWMLVGEHDRCITQREKPALALFQTSLTKNAVVVTYEDESISIPMDWSSYDKRISQAKIHDDIGYGRQAEKRINQWFSERLNQQVVLLRKSNEHRRQVKNHTDAEVAFSDASPYLIVGTASIELLNDKLNDTLLINRFRPNIVFHSQQAHVEDTWSKISINNCEFLFTKTCSRCKIITINQETAEVGKEPILTLGQYRLIDRKIKFGAYYKSDSNAVDGNIRIGDSIIVDTSLRE